MIELPDRLAQRFEASTIPLTVADPHSEDRPLVFVNAAFERLTGYTRADIVGKNCRFLQGTDTDPSVRRQIAEAITERRDIACKLRNYKKSGTPFDNFLMIRAISNHKDECVFLLGSQFECGGINETVFRQHLDVEDGIRNEFLDAVHDAHRQVEEAQRFAAEMFFNMAVRIFRGYGPQGVLNAPPELNGWFETAAASPRESNR